MSEETKDPMIAEAEQALADADTAVGEDRKREPDEEEDDDEKDDVSDDDVPEEAAAADKQKYGTLTESEIDRFDLKARQRFDAEMQRRSRAEYASEEIRAGSAEAEAAVREAIRGV